MAAILDAFASKLVGVLAGMAKEEVELLLGVPGEISKLETTLGDLSGILADAERRRIRDTAAERWVRELKDVMYDADNILDLCHLVEGGEDPSSVPRAARRSFPGCSHIQMLSCFRNPVAAHKIGKKIQVLNQRLLDIQRRSSGLGFISQMINSSSYSVDKADSSWLKSNRKTGPAMIRSDIVGEKFEEDAKDLVNRLINKVDARSGSHTDGVAVVAITGAGGIGKTTLARMIYNDSLMSENFDRKIWLSVNKEVNEIAVLQSIISALGGSFNGFAGDKALLEDALRQAVKGKKFLLVMDDVWSDKVWNEVLRVPLNDGASGSRVLATTRKVVEARGMKAHHIHRVDKLMQGEAWCLLKKQVVLNESDEYEVDALDYIGKKIVEKCDGLPLAIKVVGGLLRNTSRGNVAWMSVLDHIAWSVFGNNDELNGAVYVSHEELPSDLKQCLLCCSLFPKDQIIGSGDIVRLWIAEGFVQNCTNSKTPEDLGLEYYRDLISRNLLEPHNKSYNQVRCTMHDVVRSFCEHVAKDEGLLVQEGQNVTSTVANRKLRHISISAEGAKVGDLQTQVSLRTLMLFRSTLVTSNLKDVLNNFCCLRVLNITDANLVEIPEYVCHLIHLRYLGLRFTSLSTMPEGIGDLKFLQCIDLQDCKNISQLPNSILKLQKLRFINIRGTKISSIPRGFGKLQSLVKMIGFPTYSDEGADGWCSLQELMLLSKLTRVSIGRLEKVPSGSVAASAKLSSKPHLTRLDLTFTSRIAGSGKVEGHVSKEEQERIEEVLGNLCPPTCIEGVAISGYFGCRLPQWMRMMSVFSSLRRLELFDYACCEQMPNGLSQLPFLDFLWIQRAPSIKHIGHDLLLPTSSGDGDGDGMRKKTAATSGTELIDMRQRRHISRVAFPKLRTLVFRGMLGWRKWEWEQELPAMPALEELTIDVCKLRYLPPGLAHHARALRYLDIRNVMYLVSVENFASLVELKLSDNPKLERIANSAALQRICIVRCPGLKELKGLPSLRTMEWSDLDAEAIPGYLREAKLDKLYLDCSLNLLKLMSFQDANSEWGNIQQLKALARESEEGEIVGHVFYTKEPYSLETNLGTTSNPTDDLVEE